MTKVQILEHFKEYKDGISELLYNFTMISWRDSDKGWYFKRTDKIVTNIPFQIEIWQKAKSFRRSSHNLSVNLLALKIKVFKCS
jgi:hypothetical protein